MQAIKTKHGYCFFSINGGIDPVARYAVVLSTIIAIWEFIRWRSRNAIKMTCMTSMQFFPSQDEKTFN